MALTMNKLFEVLPKLIEVLPRLADAIIRLADLLLPEPIDKDKRIEGKSYFMDKFQRWGNFMQDKGYVPKTIINDESKTVSFGKEITYYKKFKPKNQGMGYIPKTVTTDQAKITTLGGEIIGYELLKSRKPGEEIKGGLTQQGLDRMKVGLTQEDIDRHIAKNGNNVTRIIESTNPSNSVSQTFNISIPIQNSGGDLNADKAKEFGRIIKDALDQEMKMSSENFKSGSIQ
jgi:hypothetical protein